jgi:hypothetical protein
MFGTWIFTACLVVINRLLSRRIKRANASKTFATLSLLKHHCLAAAVGGFKSLHAATAESMLRLMLSN